MGMSFRRSVVGTGVLGLLVALLQTLAMPMAAHAAEPEPVLFYLDHFVPNDSHGYQVMRRDPDGSTRVLHDFGFLGPLAIVTGPAVSGRTETLAISFRRKVAGHMATDVYLMDESGSSMRSVLHLVDDAHYFSVIDFNPNGSELWIDEGDYVSYTHTTWILDVRTGTFARLAGSSAYFKVLPDPQAPTQFFADTTSGGTPTGVYHVANGTATRIDHGGGAVSGVGPAGDLIAIPYAGHTEIATRDGSVVNADLGPADPWHVDFSPAETWVYSATSQSAQFEGGAIVRDDVGQSAQTPQVIVSGQDVDHDLEEPVVAPADSNPPGIASASVRLGGANPLVRIANPSDEDFSHVILRRYNGSTASGTPVTKVMPWHATSYRDTVTLNGTYTYTVTAVDGAGNEASPTSVTMQALVAPALRMPRIASDTSTSPPFRVRWQTASHPAGTTYDVQFLDKTGRSGPVWRDWLLDTPATSATYGAGSQTPYLQTWVPNKLRVRAIDQYGNHSPWVAGGTLEPLDDSGGQLSYSGGWSTSAAAGDWQGHLHRTAADGASVLISAYSRTIFVIGDRCPSCGSFRLYFAKKLIGTFSSHSSTLRHRQVLAVVSARTFRLHRMRLVNVPTSQRRELRIDAIVRTLTQETKATFP